MAPNEEARVADLRENELSYLSWSDRAFHFYLAARLLWFNELWMPCLFCAQQAVETMLKAACHYYDPSFDAQSFSHRLQDLEAHLKQLTISADKVSIPRPFYFEGRWQAATRYPEDKGVGWDSQVLDDLDQIVTEIVRSVPFQFTNSHIYHVLWDESLTSQREILAKNNQHIESLREFVKQHARSPSEA